MTEEEDNPPPRWDVVTKAYDVIDGEIDKMVNDNKMNMLELSIVFMMVNKRLGQQDIGMYLEYVRDEHEQSAKDSGLYK